MADKTELQSLRHMWSSHGPPTGSRFGMPIETDEGAMEVTVYFARPEEGAGPFLRMREQMAADLDAE